MLEETENEQPVSNIDPAILTHGDTSDEDTLPSLRRTSTHRPYNPIDWTPELNKKVVELREERKMTWRQIAAEMELPTWQSVQMHYLRHLRTCEPSQAPQIRQRVILDEISRDWNMRWRRISIRLGNQHSVATVERMARASFASLKKGKRNHPLETYLGPDAKNTEKPKKDQLLE